MGASASKKQAYAEGVRVDLPWGDKKMQEGVWAEKLEGRYSGKQDVKNNVPTGVQALMERKGATDLYQEFITFLADSNKDFTGSYQSDEIHKIEEMYNGRFAERGIHVFYCRKTISDQYYTSWEKWIEFVDISINPTYVPKEYHASKEAKAEAKRMAEAAAAAQIKAAA
mmetsp:Transcript_27756/g.65418  ORF Transcript_27756/g.65418 Transcript_27756/m.65418 type:complete len:169 (-) Transcript_27756:51-557(-)